MNADRQSEARSSIREEPIQAAHAPTPGRLKKLSLVHMSAPNSEQSHAWSLTEAEHLLSGDVTTLLADQATLVLSTRHLLSGKQETGSKLPLKIKKADIWQFARFCVVGSLNAIIDFLVLNMLFWTHPPTDMWLVLSYNSAAVLLAATNSFFWNKYWTFRQHHPITTQEVSRFATVAGGTILMNDLLMWLLAGLFPWIMRSTLIGANALKLGAIIGTMSISFFGMRLWVFFQRRYPGARTRSTKTRMLAPLRSTSITLVNKLLDCHLFWGKGKGRISDRACKRKSKNQQHVFDRGRARNIFHVLTWVMLLPLLFQPSAATEMSRATGPLFRPAPSLAQLDAAISRTEQYINQLYKPIDNQTATTAEYYSVPLRVYLTRYHRWILLGENSIAFCKVSFRGENICPLTSTISEVVNRQSSETFVAEFRSPESSTSPQIRVDVNWNYNTTHYQIKLTNEQFVDQSTTALVYLYDLYIDTFSSRNVGHSAMLTLAKTDFTHLHSFRYTIRHGNQLLQNYYWYKQDLAKYERLARFLVQQGYQLDYDIYAPIWGYGTSYPDNLPYHISSGDGNEVYHDCHASHWNSTLDYLYQSKLCKVGVATYVAISQSDLLTTSIQAMHILNKYGDPERSYLDGGNQQSTPIGAATELEQKFNQSRIGIPICSPIGCNYDIASGIRTFSFGALETKLGYGYGRQTSRDYADTVARLALEVQVGDDQTLLMADGGTFYRPAQKGAFYLSWDASMRYAKSEPLGYRYLNDLLNMPDEYRGVLVSDMETTLDAYAFLVLYRCKKYDVGCAVGVPKPLIALSSGTSPVHIARAYSGTLYNMMLDMTTHMSLSRIQQGQSDLLGYITGVQVNGHQVNEPFSGSIDAHEHIQFTFAEYAGQVMLSFDGSVQSNGTLAGNYCSLDQQGQCAGEYGVWSVVPVATGASR